jgi:hypothetical protein
MAVIQGDVGYVLSITVPADVSLTSVTVAAVLRQPDGSAIKKEPILTVGTRTYTYTTVAGDLRRVGVYSFSLDITDTASGKLVTLEPVFLTVWGRGRATSRA